MPALKLNRRRVVGMASLTCLLAFATLSLSSLPAGAQSAPVPAATACPVLSLGNPSPADDLSPGGMLISGTAFEPTAAQGAGVERVDLFLGERDSGGTFLGSAVPGETAGGDPRAFSVEVQIPDLNRGVDFAAYAISPNGQQTAVTFPVFVGTPPAKSSSATPTPIPTTENLTSTCGNAMPAAVAASGAPAASAPMGSIPAVPVAPMAGSTGAAVTGTTGCPVLSLGNPNPADDLTPGGYFISGTAFDPAAAQGSGVSRVDLFLGERDNGGTPLGSAVPGNVPGGDPRAFSVEVQVPNITRGLDFAAYAISSITGQETIVTFPVLVGQPPAKNPVATPTPIPSVETVTTTCGTHA
jgi:hypothetical protein